MALKVLRTLEGGSANHNTCSERNGTTTANAIRDVGREGVGGEGTDVLEKAQQLVLLEKHIDNLPG